MERVQPGGILATLFDVRWWWCAAGLMATVGLVAGCDVGSIRRPATVRTSPPVTSASTRSTIIEFRHVRVPVPPSFILQTITFVDSRRGYALYARCGENSAGRSGCEVRLIATMDGGRSWSVRRHPQPFGSNQQIVVGGKGAVMLLADPYGWYLSRDGGLTFRHTGPPALPPDDYFTAAGRFQVWHPDTGPTRVVEYRGRHRRDLPVQPPLPDGPTDVKYDESGRLWVAGLDRGTVAVALSRDQGRTWQRQPVGGPNGSLVSAWLEVSAGGGDVWLLARSAPGTFPRLWRFDGTDWVERPAAGAPPRVQSVAALGSGALAVALPGGAGLVQGGYSDTNWPLAGANLKVLADGTLMATKSPPSDVFLGLGHGIDRQWVQVTLELSRPAR